MLDNIPFVKNKLAVKDNRMNVRTKGENINVISEFIDLYCPQNGTVLDAYAGILTTTVACLQMARSVL